MGIANMVEDRDENRKGSQHPATADAAEALALELLDTEDTAFAREAALRETDREVLRAMLLEALDVIDAREREADVFRRYVAARAS
jgi:hypothetical protein